MRRQLFPTSATSQNVGQTGSNMGPGNTVPASHGVGLTPSASAPAGLAMSAAGAQDGGLVAANPLPPVRVDNVPPVLKAAKAINSFLQMDESFPDLDSYCRRKLSPAVS